MTARQRITADEAERLFRPLEDAGVILLAVSGGADSTALLVLASEWIKCRPARLLAATVDHRLRQGSGRGATQVGRLAARLRVPHKILAWTGPKPATGIEEAAREARYALLEQHARKVGATHLVTAHTRDDQAETVLLRLAAGSGPAGLAGMRQVSRRGGLVHVRPLLGVAKSRLVATLDERGIPWEEDAMNADPRYARPRLRAARTALEREGLTQERLAVLATRMARMTDALDRVAAAAWPDVAREVDGATVLDGAILTSLPEELGLRLLIRAIGARGDQLPDRLARAENLFSAVREALASETSLGRTLAGAKVSVRKGQVVVTAAPPRRSGRSLQETIL